MTKKEIKTEAFILIADYVLKGHSSEYYDIKTNFICRAYAIVDMLAELNMLTDQQIKSIKDNIFEGVSYD